MEFHLQLDPIPFERKITVNDAVMLLGSCFTEHIYERLYRFKFNVQQNPNGILFNPKSIAQSIGDYISKRELNESEFFFQNGIWNHWQFHSSLSNGDLNIANNIMNEKIQHAHEFLAKTNWLIITFGSAIVYDLDNGQTVANCHKSPSNIFNRRMLSIDEIIKIYSNTIESLLTFNPTINLIFTVSPVRHLKEGFVENNRSKSRLIIAIEKLTEMFDCCHYFPSYELVIDDLRDYRFYAEDMVHPNYLATNYVWEKFSTACIDGKSRQIFKELQFIYNAFMHRPMHPESEEHKKFKAKTYQSIIELSSRFPGMDFSNEIEHFKA